MEMTEIQLLNQKIDRLTDAVSRLILIEERQVTQAEAIKGLQFISESMSKRISSTESKLEKWINMGIGGWGVAVLFFTFWQTWSKL